MAFDLEAIKRKLAAMNGERGGNNGNTSGVQQWKPEVGEYKIRVLPWKNVDSSMPFIERSFYFFGKFGCLAPVNGEDPVNQLRMHLFQEAKKDESFKVLAKQLFPKTYWYAKIIVRGQEDKGEQVWKFSKMACQRLLGFFVDEDIGDFTDLENGYDLKVKISKTPGKDFMDTTIDAGKQCPAHKDPAVVKGWFDKELNIDDLHRNRFKSVDEIKSALDAWLDGGESVTGNEVTKGGGPKALDELDQLANDVSKAAKPSEKKAEAKTEKKKASVVDDDDDAPAVKTDLDSAFEDLMNDDD